MEELLEEFIDWAKDCGEDAWYIFDHTDEAIQRFMERKSIAVSGGLEVQKFNNSTND